MRAIPLARSARRRHRLEPPIVGRDGTLDARNAAAARGIAARLNAARADGTGPLIGAGEITALAALDAVLHRVVQRERERGRADLDGVAERVGRDLGPRTIGRVATAWTAEFRRRPSRGERNQPVAPRRGGAAAPRAAVGAVGTETEQEPGSPAGPDLLAELLVLAALNENRAAQGVRELVDDQPLRAASEYDAVVAATERELGGRGPVGALPRTGAGRRGGRRAPEGNGAGDDVPLPARLRQPMAGAPGSLFEQLRWIREHWPEILADDPALAERLALALDVLAEEARALELRGAQAGAVFGGGIPAERPDYRGLDAEPEAFSADTEWMPSVVLLAKSSYVWLEQLARSFARPVDTLADVPDAELDRLANLGVTGLWLIGLWQRSAASADIKRRRGDAEAVASAYAIDDYRIADDLGGEAAFEQLRERAWARGIRLAADMVPNHMGIDSRWVIEHPERFLSVGEPPFPAYTFTGPNLSPDPRVEITLEDHYWDGTDAAVVFRRRDAASGETRFIYHGNDGTSFPWNDTAQLDYLKADVREAVIRTILDVARRAPILRFDAAMVLARRHIRRLWYPEPGGGGAIPSRAEHAMSDAAFNRAMPREFWREVVDRVAAEAPGTLLLAEAFWLMEGYFVRTLGMHRVYNSAFMHMLRDEDNAAYRKVMRDTLEFDPGVLQRFVNFMTNPDERPAAEQYGTGDKAFSAATLLATLPGLPMLGHGQVEGFRERYGMEFRKARLHEPIDEGHAAHFERQIVPLLRRRRAFSGTSHFRLYDALAEDGHVVEDVYAYSNGSAGSPGGDDRSLVLVHHRFADATVRIDRSVRAAVEAADGARRLRATRLAEALELPRDPAARVRFFDPRSGWETIRTVGELRHEGLRVSLGPYEARVLSIEMVAAEPATKEPGRETEPAAAEPTRARPRKAAGGSALKRVAPADRAEQGAARPAGPPTPRRARPKPVAQAPKSDRRRRGKGSSPPDSTDSR
jgi:glycosidase